MSGSAVRRLCLFDLDGTLIREDSNALFGAFLGRIGWVDPEEHDRRQRDFHDRYHRGVLDLSEYIDFTTSLWRERPWHEALEVRRRFMAEVLAPLVDSRAQDLTRRHLAAGDLVAMVTATTEFVTEPIAQAFGVPHLLGVQLEPQSPIGWTGRIRGVPTFREGKVARVQAWLDGLGLKRSDFETVTVYSDSTNDLPLLEWATHPVATNPVPGLEAIARERGWPILKLLS